MKHLIAATTLGLASLTSIAQPIRIVGPFDLSGAAADVGRDSLAGVQYAIEKINASGGVLGRQLVLEHQDSGSNPQRGVSQATALLRDGTAALLLAPQSSASALAVTTVVTAKLKVPTCVSVSTVDGITMKDFNPYIYSVTPTAFMEGRAQAARYAKLPYKRYALMSADYAGGRTLLEAFKTSIKQANPQVEFVAEDFPKFGATDYTASINKLLAAKPDYVFTTLFGTDLITFAKQATALGFFAQINNKFGALYDFNTLKTMGDNAPMGTDGVQRAPANYLAKSSPEAAEFINGFKAKTGRYPSDWTIESYDCMAIWAQAANSAKSVEPEALMRAIESRPFNSVRGTFHFAKYDHEADAPVYFGKVSPSKEFDQPVLNIEEVVPGAVTRPTEAMILQSRRTN